MNTRKQALHALIDIVEEGAYSNLRLQEIRASGEDTAFICALVYAALEHLFWTDYMLSFYCKRQKKTVRNILRLAVTELFFMHTPDHAAVSEAVSLCRSERKAASASLVNAVLRSLLRDRDCLPALPEKPSERLSVEYTVPEAFISEWLEMYGAETTERMLHRTPPRAEMRAQWPYTTEELLNVFQRAQRGETEKECLLLPPGEITPEHPLLQTGKAVFQSEGAMAICRFAGVQPGEKVLDACAAPGGKSACLFSMTGGRISLTCMELHPHRAALMEKNFQKLGVQARLMEADAAAPQADFYGLFDTVLLDVPCSGLGLIQTKPDVGVAKNEADFTKLVQTQAEILETCSRYVKPGGKLVYATCTVSKRENGEQTAQFLQKHPEFSREEEQQLLPNIHGSGGYYMARLRLGI